MARTALEKLATTSVAKQEAKTRRRNVAFELSKAEIVDENNKALDWNVFGALLQCPLELTITGASTVKLVVEDPKYELLNDPAFIKWMWEKKDVSLSSSRNYTQRRIIDSKKTGRYADESEFEWILPQRPIDINLDGIWFRLCAFEVNETKLTLTFEDRVAAVLRSEVGRLVTAERGKFTRAQFIHKLCREAEQHRGRRYGLIPVFIPEEKIVQPVAESNHSEKASDLKSSSKRALGTGDGITVKGVPANSAQLQVINEALETAVELKAPFKAQVALLDAIIQEESATNAPNHGADEEGCLNVLGSTARSMGIRDRKNVHEVVAAFLEKGFTGAGGAINLAKTQTNITPGNLAQAVQGSAFGGEETYGKHTTEAEHAVRVYGAGTNEEGGSSTTVPGPYDFTRGPHETSWDCIQRLASEVSWYAFVRENTLWYVSGDFLLAQEPQMHVERGKDGVDWVNPHIDIGARDSIAEVQVIGRAKLWAALSGNCVSLTRLGPASGRWVVNSITFDILDRSDKIDIKLEKTLPARPEPPSTTTEESLTGEQGNLNAPSQSALAAFNASDQLSKMQLPYLFGGGHSNLAEVSQGLDCSGSTCWVLHQAGMFNGKAAITSGELENWGQAGKGKEMTVWAGPEHVYIEFNIPGHEAAQMNTNNSLGGPRLITLSKGGSFNGPNGSGSGGPFVPRHWPGT